MVKLQRFVDVKILLFYFCLLTSGISVPIAVHESESISAGDDYSSLLLVSAVFRHGDRTADEIETYPNDPYKHKDFYPDGHGQLTIAGKIRAYNLGLMLRGKYNSFLGDVYYPPNVYARSTDVSRTKMTLQLVLAALYPPVDGQKWNSNLTWQPMEMTYIPKTQDDLLFPFVCSTYVEMYKDLLQSSEVKKKIEQFNDFMETVSKYTGENVTSITNLTILYTTLYVQYSMNLPLPKWTQDMFPNGKLLEATLLFYKLLSYDKLKYFNGGVLLNTIIEDMNKVINKSLTNRKINLFSAHDLNVAAILHALNIPLLHTPGYTSSVIIELHKKSEAYFVKVLYYLGTPSNIKEIRIPGCEILCPYNKFVELTWSTNVSKEPCNPAKIDGITTRSE